ncbi:MAG: GNAT family N-acetyltransferase [Actinomycetota bacterium]|nr:GNAT family N-acetyltransferase [Actinomycetota bacterium]
MTNLASTSTGAAAPRSPALRQRPPIAHATVRPAGTRADWLAATRLLHDYVAWIEHTGAITVRHVQPAFADELSDLERAYSSPASVLLVADDGGGPSGTVAVRIDHTGDAEVKRLYVDPATRGRGLADLLLRTGLGWARRAGAARAWLETVPGLMDPAIGLYRRHGFRHVATTPLVGIDHAIVMALELTRSCAR